MKRIASILVGGSSSRMGHDKAAVELDGVRLIDHVIAQLRPQADCLLLSSSHDYQTGLNFVPDSNIAPRGPVAGVMSINEWIGKHEPNVTGFFTAPVDGPFIPDDLLDRLACEEGSAIATDGDHDHPTYAYWSRKALSAVTKGLSRDGSYSLKYLAEACAARRVVWHDAAFAFNINTPEDLETAKSRIVEK